MHTDNIPTSYHLGTYSRACVWLTDELHSGSECRERRDCEVGEIEDHTGKGCGAGSTRQFRGRVLWADLTPPLRSNRLRAVTSSEQLHGHLQRTVHRREAATQLSSRAVTGGKIQARLAEKMRALGTAVKLW